MKKFYVMTGHRDEDLEGPFDTVKEACEHLGKFISEWSSPEMFRYVVVSLENNVLDLVKEDVNGSPINGHLIYFNNEAILHNGEIVHG